MVKKKIGIKYCGGCNPSYERVGLIQRVQFQFNDRFLFLRHDEQNIDVFILINGCHRTCASRDLNPLEIPHYSITGENDFQSLMDWLNVLDGKGHQCQISGLVFCWRSGYNLHNFFDK